MYSSYHFLVVTYQVCHARNLQICRRKAKEEFMKKGKEKLWNAGKKSGKIQNTGKISCEVKVKTASVVLFIGRTGFGIIYSDLLPVLSCTLNVRYYFTQNTQ